MSFESAEAVTAAAVGIAAAILAWNHWITADSMLFGLLLAGLVGLAVAGVVFLVCKVFSYYRKKRHPEAPVVSFFSSEGGMLIASPLEGKLLPLDGIEDPVFSAEVLGKGCAISAANLDKDAKASPLISVGYSKLNLFGEDMVTSCGVAARALNALAMAGIEVLLITTSDLDISLLVHAENEDAAYETLKKAYEL